MSLEEHPSPRSQDQGTKVNRVTKAETTAQTIEVKRVMPWRVDLRGNSKKTAKTLAKLLSSQLNTR